MDDRPVEYMLGPRLLHVHLDLFLQGILSTQFVTYYGRQRSMADPLAMKIFVAIIALLSYSESFQTLVSTWLELIHHFGDLEGALLLQFRGWSISTILVDTAGSFLVQLYFCSRLYMIARNWYVAAPLAIVFTFANAASIVASYEKSLGPAHTPEVVKWFGITNSSVLAADIVLTSSTAYYLIRTRKDVLPQSVGLVNALMRLTFQTAAPSTILVIINTVVLNTFPDYVPGARGAAGEAAGGILATIYAFAMMWTLNARADIRATHLTNEVQGTVTPPDPRSFDLSRDTDPGAMEPMSQNEPQLHSARGIKRSPFQESQEENVGSFAVARARSDASSESEELVFASPRPKAHR
ncbi:hypothetical protein FB451DRAFT_450528 [Mycena latifolia]|nr:hypothetical protein FB451DRAFT_450528 [Mycena latifolia]